jgi:hypothetical protein
MCERGRVAPDRESRLRAARQSKVEHLYGDRIAVGRLYSARTAQIAGQRAWIVWRDYIAHW